MKIFRMIGILGLALSSFKVEARTMATGMPTGMYTVSAFDKARNVLYLGEVGTTAAEKVVRVAVDASGQLVATDLSGTTFVANKAILKLDVDDDGNLLVSNGTASFYILPKAYQGTPVAIASPIAQNITPANSTFKEVCFGSKDASGKIQIFGAIPGAGSNFSVANGALRLYTFDGTNIVEAAVAPLALTVNFFGNSGGFSDSVMHWDADLQRLYVGAKGILTSTASGNCFLKVVRIDATNALLASDFSPAGANSATNQNPIGIYGSTANYSINFVKTIKSQVNGKKYLVAQVDHLDDATPTNKTAASLSIYAFPVVDATTAAAAVLGCAAKVDATSGEITRTTVATAAAETYARITTISKTTVVAGDSLADGFSDVRALVGGNHVPSPLTSTNPAQEMIKHMTTFGDSVIATSFNASATPQEVMLSGTYSSSPIYDADGEIRGWTPWARAFAGSNPSTSELRGATYLGSDGLAYVIEAQSGTSANVVYRVDWKEQASSGLATQVLSDFTARPWMVKSFPLEYKEKGLFGTLGTSHVDLTIFGSKGKVAISVNGDPKSGIQADAFMAAAPHYVTYDCPGQALCAELTRLNVTVSSNSHGYVFVGTSLGLYVLSKDTDGSGFDARDLTVSANGPLLDLATAFTGMSFKKVVGITGAVHALHSTSKYLYVMGKDFVKRIRLHNGDTGLPFSTGAIMFGVNQTLTAVASGVDITTPAAPVSEVVVQDIMTPAQGELYVDMVGFPNAATIFVASISQSGKSTIYNLFGDEISGDLVKKDLETSKKTVSGYVRKMALRHINYQNYLLNSAASTPGWINQSPGSNKFFEPTAGGVIGNLVVFLGDLASRSVSVNMFELKGCVKFSTANLVSPELTYQGPPNTLSGMAEISTASSKTVGCLPNAVDVACGLTSFGSTYGGRSAVNILSGDTLSTLSFTEQPADLSGVNHAYGFARIANGSLILFTESGPFFFR